jgi:thioredoxin 1
MKLIKFKRKNCPPCHMLETFLEVDLKVEVDKTYDLSSGDPEALEMAGKFGIMSTPVLILLDDEGKEIERVAGVGQSKIRDIVAKRGLI